MLQKNKVEVSVCGRCKQPITDVCYVSVCASMVLQKNFGIITPQIFYNPESAENFAQRIDMHPTCWIATLRDHDVKLHDMKGVGKKALKDLTNKKPKQKQKKKKRRLKK